MGIPQKSTRTKTRRRLRDLDQISEDLRSHKHLQEFKTLKAPEDLPGLGLYYCVQCAKYFESENSRVSHLKGSTHKRRVKALNEIPYSQKEAEGAIGLRTDNGPPRKTGIVNGFPTHSGAIPPEWAGYVGEPQPPRANSAKAKQAAKKAAKENAQDVEVEMENSGFLEDSIVT